jgi:hypothetical protein
MKALFGVASMTDFLVKKQIPVPKYTAFKSIAITAQRFLNTTYKGLSTIMVRLKIFLVMVSMSTIYRR